MSKEKNSEELLDDQELGAPEEIGDEEAATEDSEKSPEELLEESRAEVVEWQDTALRSMAEFENYKKRMERERSTMLKYSGEPIFRELLPVVDNLELAINSSNEGKKADKTLIEGLKLTLNEILRVFEKFNVKPISARGETFDPAFHEAVMREETDDYPENTVLSEFQKGYLIHDRLLRPAMVVVAAPKSDEE